MFCRYSAHEEKRALFIKKRKKRKSEYASMHKDGLTSNVYNNGHFLNKSRA